MKRLIYFLVGVALAGLLILPFGLTAPEAPQLGQATCPRGNTIGIMLYDDHAEFYYDSVPEALFAAAVFDNDAAGEKTIVKISVRTKDNIVHNYSSYKTFIADHPGGLCGVALTFLPAEKPVGYNI